MRHIGPWVHYLMDVAKTVATRSKDPKTQVGAVIVDSKFRILATGYNGFPPGIIETAERWLPENKKNYVVHAEANAIAFGGRDLDGGVLYVTLHPCSECAKLVISSGIKTVVYQTHREEYALARELLAEAGVELIHLTESPRV